LGLCPIDVEQSIQIIQGNISLPKHCSPIHRTEMAALACRNRLRGLRLMGVDGFTGVRVKSSSHLEFMMHGAGLVRFRPHGMVEIPPLQNSDNQTSSLEPQGQVRDGRFVRSKQDTPDRAFENELEFKKLAFEREKWKDDVRLREEEIG